MTPNQNNWPLPEHVAEQYLDQAEPTRTQLLWLRELILDIAANTAEVGQLSESLTWGQATFTTTPKTGTPIRVAAAKPDSEHDYELLVHCATTLIADFQTMHPDCFTYCGNRAVLFSNDTAPPLGPLTECIRHALTYHVK